MQTPTIEQISTAIRNSWAADTTFDAGDWSSANPARGQCVVSALVVQDYLGGDLQCYEVTGGDFKETHYTNLLDGGVIVDVTASQYKEPVHLIPTSTNLKGYASIREKRLADGDTRRRYKILKRRVQSFLATR